MTRTLITLRVTGTPFTLGDGDSVLWMTGTPFTPWVAGTLFALGDGDSVFWVTGTPFIHVKPCLNFLGLQRKRV